MNQECLSIFVASSAYLFLKMFSNSLIQGYARFRSKNFKYVEDQKFFAKSDEPPKPQTDLQKSSRCCLAQRSGKYSGVLRGCAVRVDDWHQSLNL